MDAVESAPATGPGSAGQATVWVGAGVGAFVPTNTAPAMFSVGPSLRVPLVIERGNVRFRASLRADTAWGTDRVHWFHTINGAEVRFYDDDHWTLPLVVGGMVGADASIPVGKRGKAYFGADVGPAWVGTFHSFGGPTQALLDPVLNDLEDTWNVDPFTSQVVALTSAHLGFAARTSKSRSVWGELGYTLGNVASAPLARTPAALRAVRDSYGWNGLDVAAGYLVRW